MHTGTWKTGYETPTTDNRHPHSGMLLPGITTTCWLILAIFIVYDPFKWIQAGGRKFVQHRCIKSIGGFAGFPISADHHSSSSTRVSTPVLVVTSARHRPPIDEHNGRANLPSYCLQPLHQPDTYRQPRCGVKCMSLIFFILTGEATGLMPVHCSFIILHPLCVVIL